MSNSRYSFTRKLLVMLSILGFFTFLAACDTTSITTSTVNGTTAVTIAAMPVSSIVVTGENDAVAITVNEGTLQMIAAILPTTAANKAVTWTVENGTGMAEIDPNGILTAVENGTVTVKATSVSTPTINGVKIITISNQTVVETVDPVDLGSANDFVILSKTGISTASSSVINGDIGVSPSPASYITGFGLTMDASGDFATSSQITGNVYASDYGVPTPANLTAAISDMLLAYTDAAGRAPDYTELYVGDLSGKTLSPGVYKWGTDVLINTNLTLNGNSNAVWIFQISGSLVEAAAVEIILTGGALAENVFWQVAGDVAIGTGAKFTGTILCMTSIAMGTNASINGKLFAQTAVTLDANAVN